MKPLVLSAFTTVNALGSGRQALWDALANQRSGLRVNDFEHSDLGTYIGRVDGLESVRLASHLHDFDCRNNRLAQLALEQDGFFDAVADVASRYGSHRVAVLIGTSTSGILETELAYQRRTADGKLPADYRYRYTHDLFSVSDFTRRFLGLTGPAYSVSTACSSSAKVFADAHRLIATGVCDAAVVGGVDSLCLTTLYGFNSLELVSSQPCRPFDAERNGISIGEGAGFAILQPADRLSDFQGVALLGYGESSDAHHMSTPHPEGAGAALAMERALARAGLGPEAIDYVNLHGTATPSNDRSEDHAVSGVFGRKTPCSSTKGWTGHTLGAAGITEAVISALCIEQQFIPRNLNVRTLDPAIESNIVLESREAPLRRVVSNSFGFGGSNCSLVLGSFQC